MPERLEVGDGAAVHCRGCGNKLGEWVHDGLIRQRHRGRHSIGLPILICCESCGKNWTPPAAIVERLLAWLGGPVEPEPVLEGYGDRTPAPRRPAMAA